jgi:hypothetical protein
MCRGHGTVQRPGTNGKQSAYGSRYKKRRMKQRLSWAARSSSAEQSPLGRLPQAQPLGRRARRGAAASVQRSRSLNPGRRLSPEERERSRGRRASAEEHEPRAPPLDRTRREGGRGGRATVEELQPRAPPLGLTRREGGRGRCAAVEELQPRAPALGLTRREGARGRCAAVEELEPRAPPREAKQPLPGALRREG